MKSEEKKQRSEVKWKVARRREQKLSEIRGEEKWTEVKQTKCKGGENKACQVK